MERFSCSFCFACLIVPLMEWRQPSHGIFCYLARGNQGSAVFISKKERIVILK